MNKALLAKLPPLVHRHPARTLLTSEQIRDMQRLRTLDADRWTVGQLSRRFGTFPGFVLAVTRCPAARRQLLEHQQNARFQTMAASKQLRAVDRVRRKALW